MGSHGELPSLEPPWDPTIWDGRRKWSQQWCMRMGMLPDNIKGLKGNSGANDINGKGNDGARSSRARARCPTTSRA